MIVVADASPLNYLIQLQLDHLLHRLFGKVFVPVSVVDDLRDPLAPREVSRGSRSCHRGSKFALHPQNQIHRLTSWMLVNVTQFC